MMRTKPNILITGTPGTGKSTLAQELANVTQLKMVNVGQFAKENDLFCGFDDKLECPILDDDQIIDELESEMSEGGVIIDYHSCDFFPERWFDIVFVLRTDNSILYDRLAQRRYNEAKMKNNIECEIFQTILDEARESYKTEIVHELQSDTPNDMEQNVDKIVTWCNQWSTSVGQQRA
ncbi:adenylate kinase isoenzyme 6-like isoform X2 [Clavelina lepadiformis]|uniref:Adenylate kinase isoenzyme 6 homolog n=1 Tax=Clavelina lepadiformis TaxID=159417 RepID=A0ABP0FHC5_CLALP